ncbi:hypothetical protein CUR178_03594 [Leishmania enriettii]|uniref:Uncharacterized protein n=1 Tax=Leishmania enriettii TaxID=5663 RepID=A0A836KIV4_LEIEN|nr:hypothetical protein CUR178_03594 [Leishmania enriettii]
MWGYRPEGRLDPAPHSLSRLSKTQSWVAPSSFAASCKTCVLATIVEMNCEQDQKLMPLVSICSDEICENQLWPSDAIIRRDSAYSSSHSALYVTPLQYAARPRTVCR